MSCIIVSSAYAQQPWVNAGNDTTLCAGTINLNATVQDIGQTNTYTQSTIPYAPDSFYLGTLVNWQFGDDEVAGPFNLGFNFCFFGQSYNQCYIGSNGWVSFSANQPTTFTSATIPSSAGNVPVNCIMGPWQDWYPGVGGTVKYTTLGTAPFRRFVVSWDSVAMFQCTTTYGTFQIVCYETTNIIENHIELKPACLTWANGTAVQGLHDPTGTIAYTVPGRNSTQWLANNEAVRYTPAGPPIPYTISWVDLNGTTVGTGPSVSIPANGNMSYIAQVTYSCSNSMLSDTMDAMIGIPNLTLSSNDALCFGGNTGSATVSIPTGGPYTYQWSTGSTNNSISGLAPGVYSVFVSDGSCNFVDSVIVSMPTILYPEPVSSPDTCSQGLGTAAFQMSGGVPPYTYLWSQGSTTNYLAGVTPGNYTVTITDSNGCDTLLTVPVYDIAAPTAMINANPATAGVNEPVTFTDASNANGDVIVQWQWTIGDSTYTTQNPPAYVFPTPGTYTVTLTVTNSLGCTSTYTMTIDISDEVEVPNVFSPNSDGKNDAFEIKFLSLYPNSSLIIYDRWGTKVYESSNYQNNWVPGKSEAHDGTYYYVLNLSDGKSKQGFVTLVR